VTTSSITQSVDRDHTSLDDGITVCVDRSEHSRKVIHHALAVASALGLPATLLHVLEVPHTGQGRPDPVEWELTHRQACDALEQTSAECGCQNDNPKTEIIQGHAADQICRWARKHSVDLIALGTSGEGHSSPPGLGKTVRGVIEQAPGSLLVIPDSTVNANTVHYKRILVPFDGSSRAESVLPLVIRLAKAQGAELLLVHVIPIPELTEIGPLSARDVELRERVIGRNKAIAEKYLNRIKTRVAQNNVAARIFMLEGDDPQISISQLITNENVDLIVLSAQGRGGRSDVSYGSVSTHLINHLTVPLLIVRPQRVPSVHHAAIMRNCTDSCASGRAHL